MRVSGYILAPAAAAAGRAIAAREVNLGRGRLAGRFRREQRESRCGLAKTLAHRALRTIFGHYDVTAALDMYPVHLLETQQFVDFFQAAGTSSHFPRALDVGAGRGEVSRQLWPLCGHLWVTETSQVCRRQLEQGSFQVWPHELGSAGATKERGTFDLVSMLNVLDRCQEPRALLDGARGLLRDGGWFLMAMPLPYLPAVLDGPGVKRPALEERLLPPVRDVSAVANWETDKIQLLELLPRHGLQPAVYSRVPYLSGGDAFDAPEILDDIVLLARAE